MTTLEPGASVVFTHGLRLRPRSTALRASRAAPIITCGFDVLVHDVIAAITTAPWSISYSSFTRTGFDGRPCALAAADTSSCGLSAGSSWPPTGGSLAGNDSRLDSSALPFSLGT
jgi:hypothetical protein